MVLRSKSRELGMQARSGLDLGDQAFHLIRRFPRDLVVYYVGAMPFVVSVLYFWSEMRRWGASGNRCGAWASLLTLLFIWMKSWQSAYAQLLRARVAGNGNSEWTWRRIMRLVSNQLALQPTGFVVLPVALSLLFPFGEAHAFYQNLTVLDDGKMDARTLIQKAKHHATLWQKQNLVLVWLMSPMILVATAVFYLCFLPILSNLLLDFGQELLDLVAVLLLLLCIPLSPVGVILSLNVAVALIAIPWFVKTFLGIETILTQVPSFWFSSVFWAVVCGLVYLIMDPFLKAAYVLRCFYGDSIRTGEDVCIAFRRISSAGKVAVFLAMGLLAVLLSSAVAAEDNSTADFTSSPEDLRAILPQELDHAITQVLNRKEFVWRFPNERVEDFDVQENLLFRLIRDFREGILKVFRWIEQAVRNVIEYIRRLINRLPAVPGLEETDNNWVRVTRLTFYALAVLLAVICLFVLVRALIRTKRSAVVTPQVSETPVPDLEGEEVRPDDLPEEKWFELAQELMQRGENRLALRALFLAFLSHLARRGFITAAPCKTNREYLREAVRRARDDKNVISIFEKCVHVFDCVWYGRDSATVYVVSEFADWVKQAGVYEQAK